MAKFQVRFTTTIEVTVEVEAVDEERAALDAAAAAERFLSTIRPEGAVTGVGATLDGIAEDTVVEL